MTVKKLLAEQKKKHEEEVEQSKIESARRQEREDIELAAVLKSVRKSLTGFRPKTISGGFSVKVINRIIFIMCKYEKHSVRYADDCDYEDVRSLCVNIGFYSNVTLVQTSAKSFEKSFVQFLNQHRLA